MPQPMVATKQMIEQVFDDAATSYNRTGPSFFSQFGIRLIELMPLSPGTRMLDIATGTGAVVLPAARRVGLEGNVIGIDLSGAILKEAEHAVRLEGLTNVELRKMDAEHLDFPDQTFDFVTCAFSLFFIPDIEAALREMYRVTKPGGYIGISIFGKTPPPFSPGWPILIQQFEAYQGWVRMPHPFAYSPEEMEALLSRFGFRSIKIFNETNEIVYTNLEDWGAFQLTIGPRLTILAMNEKTRARFKDEYFAKLRPMFRQDGLHLSVSILYTIAQR